MKELYRSDYDGEYIITETTFSGGQKTSKKEWLDSTFTNTHTSQRAVVVGSNADMEWFDHTVVEAHTGGLHGTKRLQKYGNGKTWHTMKFDIIGTTEHDQLHEIKRTGASRDTTVFTTPSGVLAHPGEYFLIPHGPRLLEMAVPLYLAAFDGHKEIYLVGYNRDSHIDHPELGLSENWEDNINQILTAYSGVKFHFIGNKNNMSPKWFKNSNVVAMTHREFILHADIG